ncbi:MAG: nucleotidyltransferase domain-containing protein [Candidatus Micrarchaeaceae archaeon]
MEYKALDSNWLISGIESNIRRLIRTSEADGREEKLELNSEFIKIYKKLPQFAEKLISSYKKVSSNLGMPDEVVRVYMVGGRVKGTPISDDSDIDIFIATESARSSIESIESIARCKSCGFYKAQIYRLNAISEIKKSIGEICKELGIPNKFDVLGYGCSFPKDNQLSSDKHILLGDSLLSAKNASMHQASMQKWIKIGIRQD